MDLCFLEESTSGQFTCCPVASHLPPNKPQLSGGSSRSQKIMLLSARAGGLERGSRQSPAPSGFRKVPAPICLPRSLGDRGQVLTLGFYCHLERSSDLRDRHFRLVSLRGSDSGAKAQNVFAWSPLVLVPPPHPVQITKGKNRLPESNRLIVSACKTLQK